MLEVEDLYVTYGGAVRALQGVTLNVPDGEVAALLGSNGAGKSTLLRCVSGTLRPEWSKFRRGAASSGVCRWRRTYAPGPWATPTGRREGGCKSRCSRCSRFSRTAVTAGPVCCRVGSSRCWRSVAR